MCTALSCLLDVEFLSLTWRWFLQKSEGGGAGSSTSAARGGSPHERAAVRISGPRGEGHQVKTDAVAEKVAGVATFVLPAHNFHLYAGNQASALHAKALTTSFLIFFGHPS
jgi:hypothetical protein